MNLATIEQIARDNMVSRREHESREPGWLYYHGVRVAKLSLWLCDRLQTDVERAILYVAGLFHDVGKGSSQHGDAGAEITRGLLSSNCTTDDLDAICTIIRRHCKRRNPDDTQATRIIQDADIIDHAGLIGIWTSFYWSGTHSENAQENARFVFGEENHRLQLEMRDQLNFEASKQVFDERIAYEEEFFTNFHRIYQEGI